MKRKSEYLIYNFRNFSKKGFFHLLSANLLIQVFAFASQLFVAGILNPDDIGRIKIIQTYLSVFSIIAGMGFNVSTLKLCSENRTENEQKSLFQSALVFTAISTVFMYFVVLVLNFFHIFSSDNLIQWLLPLGLFPVISNSLFMVYVAYFQATKQIKLLSGLTITNKIISILGIILLTFWLGIKGYYLAYNLSFIVMLVVCIKIFRFSHQKKQSSSLLKDNLKIHWNFAKPSLFANLLSELSSYVDIILVNFLVKDMTQIGYYSFALTLTLILRLFPGTVQQISSPYFSSLSTNKDVFLKAFKKYNRILFVGVGITFIVVNLLSYPALHWVFQGKYDESVYFFLILSVGWSFRQLVQLQSAAIFGLGKIHFNAYISLITLIFNVIVYTGSYYTFGLSGIAFATIPSGIVFWAASRFFYLKAKTEVLQLK